MTEVFSLSPLLGTRVGLDRFSDLFDRLGRIDADTHPSYDIERTGDDAYRITLAVAGFVESDLSITTQTNKLVVCGRKQASAESAAGYLHRGIAAESFQRVFQLADFVVVTGAELKDGLLRLDLVRQIPDEQKPQRIEIKTGLRTLTSNAKDVQAA